MNKSWGSPSFCFESRSFLNKPAVGIEPTACCLRNSCSTAELGRRVKAGRAKECSTTACPVTNAKHLFYGKLRWRINVKLKARIVQQRRYILNFNLSFWLLHFQFCTTSLRLGRKEVVPPLEPMRRVFAGTQGHGGDISQKLIRGHRLVGRHGAVGRHQHHDLFALLFNIQTPL